MLGSSSRACLNDSASNSTYPITAMIVVSVEQGDWPSVREQLVHLPGFEYLAVAAAGSASR
jgi:hypothetical protein